MDIQKLLKSGYNLYDIKELLALLLINIKESKKVFTEDNDDQIKLTIHKLKGGLIMLEFTDLIDLCTSIEDNIKTHGVTPNKSSINSLLENCLYESISASKNLEILISNNDVNS